MLVLGKGQQEICKTEFNFDAAHMQNKKINKKHIPHNKESLFGVRRSSLLCQFLSEHHKHGEREVSGTARRDVCGTEQNESL